jgi:hypothetical protein
VRRSARLGGNRQRSRPRRRTRPRARARASPPERLSADPAGRGIVERERLESKDWPLSERSPRWISWLVGGGHALMIKAASKQTIG